MHIFNRKASFLEEVLHKWSGDLLMQLRMNGYAVALERHA